MFGRASVTIKRNTSFSPCNLHLRRSHFSITVLSLKRRITVKKKDREKKISILLLRCTPELLLPMNRYFSSSQTPQTETNDRYGPFLACLANKLSETCLGYVPQVGRKKENLRMIYLVFFFFFSFFNFLPLALTSLILGKRNWLLVDWYIGLVCGPRVEKWPGCLSGILAGEKVTLS